MLPFGEWLSSLLVVCGLLFVPVVVARKFHVSLMIVPVSNNSCSPRLSLSVKYKKQF